MCNLAFAVIVSGMDSAQREEFLDELTEDDTDWETQAAEMFGG